jgi:hypothetical protein
VVIGRSTLVVDGPLAMRVQRAAAAREGRVGREILTLPLVAARLAGGFIAPAATDLLYPAIQAALAAGGFQDLGDVASLPGMPFTGSSADSISVNAGLSSSSKRPPASVRTTLRVVR